MVTTNPTRDNITAANPRTDREFVQALTEYAMHASPERIAEMMEKAYGDHGPSSVKRWHVQQAARQGWPRPQTERPDARCAHCGEPFRRKLRTHVYCSVWCRSRAYAARPACERCRKQFHREWPRHRQRFCSVRCRRSAARLRELAVQRPTGNPVEVLAECRAALERLRAIVFEEAGR